MAKLGSLCFYLGIMALAAGVSQLAAKRNKKWLLLIPIAVLSLVAGLRASTVGTDTQNVLATMEYCYRHHFWDHSKEWLFYFLCEYTLGLLLIFRFDYTFEQESVQTLVCGVCEMAVLPLLYELALCSFSLIWKRKKLSCKIRLLLKGDPVWRALCGVETVYT